MLYSLISSLTWYSLSNAVLYTAAGLVVFLFLFNRVLNKLRHGKVKRVVALTLLILCLPVPALTGLFIENPWSLRGLAFPGVVLALYAVGELRLTILGRERRGAQPNERHGPRLSLTRPVTTTDLISLNYSLPLHGWNGPAFRVAHISDLHVNHKLPDSYYQQAIEQVNRTNPDLIFITGDFISGLGGIPRLMDLLPLLHSRLGIFAVLGNHDYWAGAGDVLEVLRDSHIIPLFNGCQPVELGGGASLLLSGCEDPFGPSEWQPPQTPHGQPMLVLSHSADSIYRLSQAGAAAVFTGHYHGGQIRVPFLGAIVIPSIYGRRFDQGHFVVGRTHLFVSAGVGAAAPAIRIYCQPDIQIVDFLPEKSA